MSKQIAIPCWFFRGGTSRGPYFMREDLPDDLDQLAKVLVAAVGAGHRYNIDGIGGGVAVTTKVAMLSKSDDEWADIDYFFAQVNVEDKGVDFSPTCGNILAGVGPAAIEMGLVSAQADQTRIRIRAVNTGAKVEAIVATPCDPDARVEYEGDEKIAGVPGAAAPIQLNFMGIVGSKTDALFPTGNKTDHINGIDVTLIDVAVPMMIMQANSFGKSGYESADELMSDKSFMEKIESIRIEAGKKMGLGDVSNKVIPKVGLISKSREQGCINVRYFMPWQCHPSLAVTGSLAFVGCVLSEGSVADGVSLIEEKHPEKIVFEHPMGKMEVVVDYQLNNGDLDLKSAGTMRTARLLMRGEIMIPASAYS